MVSVGTLEKRRFVLKCFKESWEHERVVAFFSTRSMVEAWLTLGEESLPEDPEIEGSKRTWERAFYTYRGLADLCSTFRKKILSLSYLIDFHEILKAESFRQSSLLHQEVHVQILGNDVTTAHGLEEAYQVLGVCPQIDPLWEFLTGREHLLFFGRVKGVPEAELNARVNNLLYRLGLDGQDADRKAVEYSGGMKRKLSLAIALIGRSPLLFLDEPSAAVDAGAKRHLWKVIRMRSRDQTVVLTTHSMEEAEALCNRIAIQVRGQLRCLGTPLHIKGKYGSGYQLELFCDPPADEFSHDFWAAKAEELMRFVRRHLSPKGSLLEHHAGRFLFQLPPLTEAAFSTKPEMRLTLGNIFIEVQKNMAELGLSDYSITQPSLEQVFVRFAREQDEDLEEAIPEAENEDAQG
eukprot:s30_g10.t2